MKSNREILQTRYRKYLYFKGNLEENKKLQYLAYEIL